MMLPFLLFSEHYWWEMASRSIYRDTNYSQWALQVATNDLWVSQNIKTHFSQTYRQHEEFGYNTDTNTQSDKHNANRA